jgi:hypothetical protein
LVTLSEAAVLDCVELRFIAEWEIGLVRGRCLSWRAPSLAAAVDEAPPEQAQLSHAGQSCAEAPVAISAATAVNPAAMHARTLVIAPSPPCRVCGSVSTYYRAGAF